MLQRYSPDNGSNLFEQTADPSTRFASVGMTRSVKLKPPSSSILKTRSEFSARSAVQQVPWFRELMTTFKLSTDWWAVLVALLTTALVRFGLLPHIPW